MPTLADSRRGGSVIDIPVAALVPLVLVVVGFVGYCLFDISRSEVQHLPKWAWALICVASVPLGGIVYLLVGRGHGGPAR